MFSLAKSTTNELIAFQFGQMIDPRDATLEVRLDWILEDYDARRDELMLLTPSQTTILLLQQLGDFASDPPQAVIRIKALGFLRSLNTAPNVEAYLDHESRQVVYETILALGRIGAFTSLPKIEPFLESSDHDLKRAAVTALSKATRRPAFAKLEAATASDPQLAEIVRQGKRKMEALEVKNLKLWVDRTLETDEYEDLLPTLEVTGEYLCEVLADTKRELVIRRRALSVLSTMRYAKAGRVIADILQGAGDRHAAELRYIATVAAGRCKATRAVEPLGEIIKEAQSPLLDAAIQSLGEIRSPKGLSALMSNWSVQGGAQRPAIRLALKRLGKIPGQELLAELLRQGLEWDREFVYFISDDMQLNRRYEEGLLDGELSGSQEAKRDAVLLLAYLGSASETDKLLPLTSEEEDPEIRELARLAMGRMGSAAK